jgi:uncharacterized membrane protein YqjE
MEQLPQRKELVSVDGAPTNRQLPSGQNKVQRIAEHTKGLFEELTSWVDLKLKLTQIEIENKIEDRVNQLVVGAIVAFFAVLALVFGLVALGLGLGAWLGHPGWGFLAVMVLLLLITGGVMLVKPRLVQRGRRRTKTH